MDEKNEFQIYGRTSYEQPLSFVKALVVDGDVAAVTLAEVGDDGWVELVAIPTTALLHVIGGEENDD